MEARTVQIGLWEWIQSLHLQSFLGEMSQGEMRDEDKILDGIRRQWDIRESIRSILP